MPRSVRRARAADVLSPAGVVVFQIHPVPALFRAGCFKFRNMEAFEYALQKTLKFEGGYQDNPNDPGNFNSAGVNIGTNMGISAPALERYLGRVPTREDMLQLAHETAAEIYRRDYWNAVRAGEIINPDLAALLFDMAVNHGPASAVRTAQRAVGVKADGRMGPVTLAALNRGNAGRIIAAIVDARANLYRGIVERKPKMQVFYKGWVKRALSFSGK